MQAQMIPSHSSSMLIRAMDASDNVKSGFPMELTVTTILQHMTAIVLTIVCQKVTPKKL